MRRVSISFNPTSSKGDHPQTGGGRLVNGIVEEIEDGRKIIKRAPGLSRFSQSVGGNKHVRGMIEANATTLLAVYDGQVEAFSAGGVGGVLGALTGKDLVTLSKDNAVSPNIIAVSQSSGAWVLIPAGPPVAYPDLNVQSPISNCFTGGYTFFAYGDRRCRATGLNSTAINSLNEIKAESASGQLYRNVAFRGQLFLFGSEKTEVWQGDQPNASGFPFNRATVIDRGIASTHAVAGWEDKFAAELIWAAQDNMVYQLRGYTPERISTPTIERDLQALKDKSSLRCSVAAHNGHPYFFLKSDSFTHVYDLLTSTWQERRSYGLERFRGERGVHFGGDWIIGDETTGDLWRLDSSSYLEGDAALVFDCESTAYSDFPNTPAVLRADFNFVGSTDLHGGDDPKVSVSWSDNGGKDWSVPIVRDLGKIGEYGKTVSINRCGRMSAHGRKWRLVVSDPAYVGLMGGAMLLS